MKKIIFILIVMFVFININAVFYKYKPVITTGNTNDWDEITIYSMAIASDINNSPIIQNDNKYWCFYSGAGNTAAPNHETSIGLAKFIDFRRTYEKYEYNPIINRADVGLGNNGQGISVFDIKFINDRYYMFCSAFYSNTDFRIAVLESTDLINWTNYTVVLNSYAKNHAPYIIEDPFDNSKLIMYYCFVPAGASYFRIGRAIANKSNPYIWTDDTVHNPILIAASTNMVYPFVEWNGTQFNMYFSKNVYEDSYYKYKTYKTYSVNDSSFPNSSDLIIDTGKDGSWDEAYISCPRKYTVNNEVFILYCARIYSANIYTNIGYVIP